MVKLVFNPVVIALKFIGWLLLSLALCIGWESGIRQVLELSHIPFPVAMFIVLLFKLIQNDEVSFVERPENVSEESMALVKYIIFPLIALVIVGFVHLIAII